MTTRRTFLIGAGATFVASGVGVAATLPDVQPNPDEALLALGEEFEAAWAAENAAYDAVPFDANQEAFKAAEAAQAETADLVEEIVNLPARTLAGLRVKARALFWTDGNRRADEYHSGNTCLDGHLVRSLLRDLTEGGVA